MCIVSLTLHKTMVMTVHNQYPDIELVSPVYFCNCETCYEYPVKGKDVGVTMKIGFRFDLDQDDPGGILMYKLRRKRNERFDHQSIIDTIYAKVIEEASKMMQLLVTWKIERLEEPNVNIMLVEYGNESALNEDKLIQLYDKVNDIHFYSLEETFFDHDSLSFDSSRHTWLMCDNTVLAVPYKVVREEDFELKITISQEFRDLDTIKSMWIDAERQVSSLMVSYAFTNSHC
jgi:hypothetical protein